LAHDLAFPVPPAGQAPLRVALSGASGLVGSALGGWLEAAGCEVLRLVRREAKHAGELRWDPEAGISETDALEGLDAVVHLAGANVAGGRWTAAVKRAIRESRVGGTRTLSEALASLRRPPRVLIAASATGYYGDRGEVALKETASSGDDWLARVARDWEAACLPASAAGVRVVNPRIGMVLSAEGGALTRLLPVFRLGLGGPLGNGRQIVSWIALDDLLGIIGRLIGTPELQGPVNAVSPNPVSNLDLGRNLGRILARPARIPAPAPVLRLLLGEMADALLLASARVRPERLESVGFPFRFPTLDSALRSELLKWNTPLPGEEYSL
jgi:uncharacterized protein (TIGR01777 family)